MNLQGKIAIVTGAASGIGLGIARRYVEGGARVAIADLKADAAEAAAAELTKIGPGEALGVAMDVTSEDAVNKGVADVVAKWGTVDVLVSNAGIQIVNRIEDFLYSDWKKMLAIHLDGAFLTTKAVLPHMQKPTSGAKHGLLGLARSVAKENGIHGIRSNVICPGFVRTPLVEKQIPEQARTLGISEEEVVKKVMLGQTVDGEFTTIEDVAEVALFFAAFPTNALTGQSLIASHGWHVE